MRRRHFLLLPAALSVAQRRLASSVGRNVSFPLQNIEGSITPPDQFFVRDHFAEPDISLSAWRLKIEGRVSHPYTLSFADLIESPTKKLEAVLECAGNGPGGSAASNAVWEGVPIADLIARADPTTDATTVILEGADAGQLGPELPSLPYSQIVPIAKCRAPESMVAFKFNDRFLPRKNGFPARALLPGWYAMDSVKWLQRIILVPSSGTAVDFQASGMNRLYNRVLKEHAGADAKTTRLTEVQVKSVIAWPPDDARLPVGTHSIRGFAWTGSGLIRSVACSPDGGRTWLSAQLESQPKSFAWVRWKCSWRAEPGDHVLMSRAADDVGHEQPLRRDPARQDGYEWNICPPVRCSVR